MTKLYLSFPKKITSLVLPSFVVGLLLSVLSVSAQVPVITSISTGTGIPGAAVTITGHFFNDTPSRNIIYFGAAKDSAISGDSTVLHLTIPQGASLASISVLNKTTQKAAFQRQPFVPEYDNSCFIPRAFNFKSKVDLARAATATGSSVFMSAVGDFDGDGISDLAIADHDSNRIYVYRNTNSAGSISASSFTYRGTLVLAGHPTNIKLGDLDGDGRLDIAASIDNGTSVTVFRNVTGASGITFQSRKTFVATLVSAAPRLNELALADFDGDGKLDIAVVVGGGDSVSILRNTITAVPAGTANFLGTSFANFQSFAVGTTPMSIAVADFNNDGLPDIATGNAGSANVTVLKNNSSAGSISFISPISPLALGSGMVSSDIYAVDIDGNGFPEIITTNSNSAFSTNLVTIFRNTSSSSTFTFASKVDITAGGGYPLGISSGDLDGDGKVDLAISNLFSNTVSLYRNTSTTGSITTSSLTIGASYATGIGPIGANIADLDGDFKPDIIVGNSGNAASGLTPTNTVSIFRNYPLPKLDTIRGATLVCTSVVDTLKDSTSGGVWSLSNNVRATISTAGVVTGVSAGQDTAIYTLICQGDTSIVMKALNIAVSPNAGTISGAATVCTGAPITLSTTGTGGTWSSVFTSIATVNSSGMVTGVTTGVDTIKYSVPSASCGTAVARHTITVGAGTAGTLSGPSAVCSGSNITLSSTATGGSWTSGATSIATVNSSTGSVHGVSAGTATMTYSLTTGCGTATSTKTITVDVAPNAGSISGATSVCQSANTTLTDGITGGTWRASNATASVNTTGVVTGTTGGIDTIQYIFTNSCGSDTAFHPITINALPSAGSISGSANVCIGSSIGLTETVTGGVWSSSSSTVATVHSSTGAVTGVATGTATITYTVTGAGSCSSTATKNITVSVFPSAGTISGVTSVCTGSSITLSTTSTGGAWSSTNTSLATVNTSGVVSGVSNGTDTIRYIKSNTCATDTAIYAITVNALPSSGTISGASNVCIGNSITLTDAASGGAWSSSSSSIASVSTSGVVTGASAGTATITYTVTTSGCSTFATKNVVVSVLPVAGTISGPAAVCPAATITLTTTGGTGGTWASLNTSAATISGSGVVRGVATGNDTLRYVVNTGCGSDTSIYAIVVNPLPVAGSISGASSVCVAATTTLTDATTGGVWSSSNTGMATVAGGVVTGVSAGLDTIRYTVTNSCGTDTARMAVTINALPSAGAVTGTSLVCVGTPVTLTPSVSGGSWSASNTLASVSGSGVVTGSSNGLDTIMYTVTNGCGSDVATHVMTISSTPLAGAISGATSVCAGSNITLSDTSTSGSWSVSNTLATISAGGVFHGVAAGIDTAFYSVSNGCGSNTASYVVTINPMPVAGTITGVSTVCAGSVVFYTESATTGIWSSTDTSIATVGSTGTVSGIAGGIDTIKYTVTNGCGTAIARNVITVIALPNAGTIAGPSTACSGVVIHLTDAVSGGTWSSNTTAIATIDATGNVDGITPGTDTIYYVVSNTCGVDTAMHTVTINASPDAGIVGGVTRLCIGASGTLTSTATGGVWSTSTSSVITLNASTGLVTGIIAGTAMVTYTVTNSCGTDTAQHSFPVNPFPVLSSTLTPGSICTGSFFTYVPASTSTGATFTWTRAVVTGITNAAGSGADSINESLANSTVLPVSVAYEVTTYAGGCSNNQTVTVVVNPNPVLSGGLSFTVCSGRPFIYSATCATPGTSIAWTRAAVTGVTPSTNSGTVYINETLLNSLTTSAHVIYSFTLTANGCHVFENVNLTVDPPGPATPSITTRPISWQCTNAMYQNFGAASAAPSGVNYVWSSNNAQVWATGSDRQYCLVNFNNPGLTYVYLTASIGSSSCRSRDSIAVYVDPNVAENPAIVYDAGAFTADGGQSSYQWGYDDKSTLDSNILAGETGATYNNSSPDFAHKYYWVITSHLWCTQKSYYTTPAAITNVNAGLQSVDIFPNPNNGTFTVNVISDYDDAGTITVTNIVGEKVMQTTCTTNQKTEVLLDQPSGIYFVTINTQHGKYSAKVTIAR